jgi:hypothetical protein
MELEARFSALPSQQRFELGLVAKAWVIVKLQQQAPGDSPELQPQQLRGANESFVCFASKLFAPIPRSRGADALGARGVRKQVGQIPSQLLLAQCCRTGRMLSRR